MPFGKLPPFWPEKTRFHLCDLFRVVRRSDDDYLPDADFRPAWVREIPEGIGRSLKEEDRAERKIFDIC